MTKDLKPEVETQESQEPYEVADSGALETADPKVGFVPGFMGLKPKEDVPDDAEVGSSPGTEEQPGEVDEQRPEGEEISPDADDPTGKRYADQQSRADKAENRVTELETQVKEIEQVQPIVQFVQQDAALRQAFNQRLSGQPISIDADPLTVPDKPLEPTRPANYNKDDANNDPESDSAKFDLAIQKYPGDVERWRENKDQIETKKADEQTLVLRQEQFMTDFKTNLKDLGAAEDEIASVLKFSQSEENNTTTNLAKALLGMYRDAQKPAEKPPGDTPTDQAAEAAATAASRTKTSSPQIVDETEDRGETVEGVAVREWQQNWEGKLLQKGA